jgi:cytochrome c-type biogenesis protein CcmH
MRWLLLLGLLLGVAQAAPASGDVVEQLQGAQIDEPPLEDPPDEATAAARTGRLTKALRCPVCQGLSVADSPSDAARAMGSRIEEMVQLGYTEDQITAYFVDRYGAWVELEPPSEGMHLVLYLLPLLILLAGGLTGLIVFGRRGRRPIEDAAPVASDPSLAPYRARILAELGESE